MSLQLKQLSSLAKVFPRKIYGKAESRMVALKNSTISYQIAYKGDGEFTYKIKSRLKDYIRVFDVGYVPSEMPAYESCDDGNYQNREPGLFPDPLFPKKRRKIKKIQKNKARLKLLKRFCQYLILLQEQKKVLKVKKNMILSKWYLARWKKFFQKLNWILKISIKLIQKKK